MIGQPRSLARAWELFRDPVTAEKRAILAERWSRLDPSLRLPGQGLGQKATGCGATIGIQPRCDFACTGCYLGREANRIPPLPLPAVLAQLDRLRAYLGPKSNVQITDGEVTLRPEGELIEILRYARSIGIVPMLMTHGDSFRRHPDLLERFMTKGHLSELSIHIDITQRGRDGYRSPRSEVELMPLRDEFAALIHAARRRTRRRLRAAMTLTVTGDNLAQVADVVRWTVRNRDAFSLLSFQPLALVGRTRKHLQGVTPADLWRQIGEGTRDFDLQLRSAEPMHFGHPECTCFVPLIAIERNGTTKLVQLIRDEGEDIAVMQEFFANQLGGVAFRDDLPIEMLARAVGMVARHPRWIFGRAWQWIDRRLQSEADTTFVRLVTAILARRVRVSGVTLTSHHFMSADELRSEVGRTRLEACVFRVPYEGRMVPMCEMNAAGLRERFYSQISDSPTQGSAATGVRG